MNLDKIINEVDKNIIDTINLLAREGDKKTLEKWLEDCKKEIKFRQKEKHNTYLLFLEKAYLETILN